jgi:citrate/tricarballylate utilization protein
MGMLLAIHLGSVLGLFVSLPYGRLAHAPYRAAALWRAAMERMDGL